jgi:hypothetical protein
MVVGGTPFRQQRAIVEHKPRRLLGRIDIDRRAGEERGGDECHLASKHGLYSS